MEEGSIGFGGDGGLEVADGTREGDGEGGAIDFGAADEADVVVEKAVGKGVDEVVLARGDGYAGDNGEDVGKGARGRGEGGGERLGRRAGDWGFGGVEGGEEGEDGEEKVEEGVEEKEERALDEVAEIPSGGENRGP